MSSNVSGIPAAPASTQHLIQYSAFTPDDGETHGVASVASVKDGEGRPVVPWSQLATIPGFREGEAIREHNSDPAVWLLGPGADTPGHPAWCHTHDDTCGDGTSVCLGETFEVGGDDEDGDTGAGWLRAGLVTSVREGTRMFIDRDSENSVSLSAAREFALLLLSLVERAQAGLAVSR